MHVAPLPDLSTMPAIEEAAAGIIREAVTNAGNHSGALAVWVEVQLREDAVTIHVQDNGKGFDPRAVERRSRQQKHIGLYLLRDRARAVGGSLTIKSRPRAGTHITARLPIGTSPELPLGSSPKPATPDSARVHPASREFSDSSGDAIREA